MGKLPVLLFCSVLCQLLQGQCTNCGDGSNAISHNGNGIFNAANAQAYFWEICSGDAVIVGTNVSKNVSVDCNSGSFKIKVVRFENGNCLEACKTYICNNGQIEEGGGEGGGEGEGGGGGGSSGDCPSVEDIQFSSEGGNGLCATGMVSIENLQNVDYIKWSWALAGHSGTVVTEGNTAAIYYPQGNWTNYYIAICAEVSFKNGTNCVKKCNSFLLDCGESEGMMAKSAIFPNPSKNQFTIQSKQPGVQISQINISNIYGITVRSLNKVGATNHVDLSEEQRGVYFVTIGFTDGSKDTKKVIISN